MLWSYLVKSIWLRLWNYSYTRELEVFCETMWLKTCKVFESPMYSAFLTKECQQPYRSCVEKALKVFWLIGLLPYSEPDSLNDDFSSRTNGDPKNSFPAFLQLPVSNMLHSQICKKVVVSRDETLLLLSLSLPFFLHQNLVNKQRTKWWQWFFRVVKYCTGKILSFCLLPKSVTVYANESFNVIDPAKQFCHAINDWNVINHDSLVTIVWYVFWS